MSLWIHPSGYGFEWGVVSSLSFCTKLAKIRFFWLLVLMIASMTSHFTRILRLGNSSRIFGSGVIFEFITFGLTINDKPRFRCETGASSVWSSHTIVIIVRQFWMLVFHFFQKSLGWTFQHFSCVCPVILQWSQNKSCLLEVDEVLSLLGFFLAFEYFPFAFLMFFSMQVQFFFSIVIAITLVIVMLWVLRRLGSVFIWAWMPTMYFIIIEWLLKEISSAIACCRNSVVYSCTDWSFGVGKATSSIFLRDTL